ncbi:MAG: glutamate synthase subunit beta [Deltaproteobacteria bacterium]|jgi:glutamate synthase (NADPH/NADH) small chain|nr:glutamate synthase subunit beta [Deltaproteobacteria bacterium]
MSEYRPIAERIKDYRPVELRPSAGHLSEELKRCQDCGIPFCHAMGCPLHNVVPEINVEALHGRWESALYKLLETSPFPEFTARVCPALCEGSCVQGLNGVAVPARQAEYEVTERGFERGWIRPLPPLRRTGLKVAVAGSGPAGLAAAFRLNRAGAWVTVYERDRRPGGFLRYGIPDFKLDKRVIDRRIRLMEAEGVRFRLNVEAGADLSRRLIEDRFDAMVIAIGARKKRDLAVPGRDLAGVLFATDYLSAQNRVNSGETASLPPGFSAAGKRVLVIGGGDTGSDCVGTANRQGASEVSQFEIMPEPPAVRGADNPWPQWPRILRTSSSHEEGCRRRWGVDSVEFTPSEADLSRVGGVRCREVAWTGTGRAMRPVPKPGSEFAVRADLVLLALGFTGPEETALRPEGLAAPLGGALEGGIYAAGDAARGPSLVVRAISDGLECAAKVLRDFGDLGRALPARKIA